MILLNREGRLITLTRRAVVLCIVTLLQHDRLLRQIPGLEQLEPALDYLIRERPGLFREGAPR